MRLLTVSDIHGNVEAVKRLRNMETNRFDAVVLAGDMGSSDAQEMINIMVTFGCPVLYVLGNWDNRIGYDFRFDQSAHHLHCNPLQIGDLVFVGFSGCDASWGLNPVALEAKRKMLERHSSFVPNRVIWGQLNNKQERSEHESANLNKAFHLDRMATRRSILDTNRELMVEVFKASGHKSSKTVVVTHDRLSRIAERMPGTLMHLFGHRHGFKDTVHSGIRCVNVSALDAREFIVNDPSLPKKEQSVAIVDAGTYTVIETDCVGVRSVTSRRLYPDHPTAHRTGTGFGGRTYYQAGSPGDLFSPFPHPESKRIWSIHPFQDLDDR